MKWHWPTAMKELDKGLKKFIRIFYYWLAFDVLLTILPKLPDPLAKKIVDKLLAMAGLGD